jgi:hypothetical protein
MAVTEPVLLVCDGAFQDAAARLAASAGIACVGADPSHPLPYDQLVGAPADEVTAAIERATAPACSPAARPGRRRARHDAPGAHSPRRHGADRSSTGRATSSSARCRCAWPSDGGGTAAGRDHRAVPPVLARDLFRTVEAERITNVPLADHAAHALDHGTPTVTICRRCVHRVRRRADATETAGRVLDFRAGSARYGSSEAGQVLYLSDDDQSLRPAHVERICRARRRDLDP